MIKVLGISGSPRKAATDYTVKTALKELDKYKEIEYEYISLADISTYQCLHCNRCIKEESRYCVVHRDEGLVDCYKKFYAADGYLLGSPVYQMNYSGQLSCFINLMRPAWNILKEDRGYFWNKAGAAIAVGGTRHGGQEMVINAIHNFYHNYGITVVGGNFAYNGGTIWSRDKREEGAAADTEGMKTVRAITDRLAATLYALKGGEEQFVKAYQQVDSRVENLA